MAPIPAHLSRCPTVTLSGDQWQEHGWIHDPETDRFHEYTIDRKDQYDRIVATWTREAFEARVLPGAEKRLRDWFVALL